MTPLERAAQAVEEQLIGHVDPETHAMSEYGIAQMVVKTVLTAIREPSEPMVQFGREVGEEAVYCDDAGKARLSVDGPREIWTEMIDALLADAR